MDCLFDDHVDKEKLLSEITQLQSISEQFRAIFDSSTDGLFVVDSGGIVLEINKAYEQMTSILREEVVGRNLTDLVLSEYFDKSASLLALQSKKTTTIIQQIKKQKFFVVTANPVFGTEPEIKMVVTSVRDVTFLHHLQQQLRQVEQINERLSYQIPTAKETQKSFSAIYGSSKMQKLLEKIKQISSFPTPVLITGPSGTGKEVLANMIYQLSSTENRPFIKVNCAAIPPELFESELFGYVGGSFTGAHKDGKPGLIELSNKGVLLLDEIGEMPLPLQAKLLRVLQDKTITRLGDTKPKQLSFRLICSTNQDLKQLVKEKKFREDLWYRINVVHLEIPPLRERKSDIRPLTKQFLDEFCSQYGLQKQIKPEAMLSLEEYSWPGNVRELKNIVEFLVVSTTDNNISLDDLPEHVRNNWDFVNVSYEGELSQTNEDTQITISDNRTLKQLLDQFEAKQILRALNSTKSMRSAAALLGIDHASLIRKMKRLEIYKKSSYRSLSSTDTK
ncbi:sigma 54-interacting transcriptional regulator [Fodinisporobacter ferrooxydans]|uniref:HTH-type transcriptional regulatory protein TyrR n=1 Tax=Fodinisporobacter ferrooxydans TaxID=2901836 RepID=A0ABY4CHM2_9BACL|nr:sigma 54-interacting transcriptional regulator [Alicyclobacillaceae bacterium MYW30-H2]